MDIIRLDDNSFPGALFEAVKTIRSGGVIVYPTDTVYGIGGNALNQKVAERICEIKERPKAKGLILLVKDHAAARKYAYIDLWTERVLEELWPGPVSVVLHKKDVVPDLVGTNGTIALRMPKGRFVEELLRQVDTPLIATSANRSDQATPANDLSSFLEYLEGREIQPDLMIDAGVLPSGEPSTLLDLTNRKNPVLLRKGTLTKSELEALLRLPLA